MSFNLVFVYGTLKRNQPNHNLLMNKENGAAKLINTGTTRQKYPLVIGSRYNIPYLLPAPGNGEHVQGEVYEVDNKMLGVLDILECHPEYYERKIDKIILQDSEEEIDCWIYLLFRYKPHMMELPFLKAYFSEGDPEKKYVAKYSREVIGKEYWSDVKIMESPSK
ncbi:putative gamma-glutamylcyclotransferase CG2811 isoform X3 [Homarus americanus]|nr:putative gamma-glutamylcyclotransferase CG2811 isoform X3 [Homarus americanus]XP_042217438.1 putative gamma-glutamylcyclotransferase CG2811 isoform X3 [Homarus americanus]XP_042217439.1 putative gamma-glutamylcyclotransferase CG2811 isoform X3 [Homarus americanus]XP_042217440.1 putative gamma-glutamylcyclotransferase CG2811 isoform X3 [Homarus americanus]XP_042217441.1 putative gamma-glutamylcyclotransferase CG2811 isoform X3 [Homarus americanus]XP_042217442.1 putative gamma-glutamylcyclotr